MYKHILLATELTNESAPIEEKAAKIQKLTGAELSIVHVNEYIPPVYPMEGMAITYNYQEVRESLNRTAEEMLSEVKQRLNVSDSKTSVLEGPISDQILSYAEEHNVDLIVTGSHGRHGISILLGSTANALLHSAKCDVLAVRIKGE